MKDAFLASGSLTAGILIMSVVFWLMFSPGAVAHTLWRWIHVLISLFFAWLNFGFFIRSMANIFK